MVSKAKTTAPTLPLAQAPGRGVPVPGSTPVQTMKPAVAQTNASALLLLDLEAQAREAATLQDLSLVMANETRKLTRARQIFVLRGSGRDTMNVVAATGLPTVDRNVPLVQWIEQTVKRAATEADLSEIREFVLHAYSDADNDSANTYPFREALWLPLRYRDGQTAGGVLMVRETPWLEHDLVLVRRLSATFSHAWSALSGAVPARRKFAVNSRNAAIALAIVALIGACPVSMTALAPFEVAPREAFLVTAAIDGVIDDILVAANAKVEAGQPLVRFVDTVLRNRVEIAQREADVAQARVKQATINAFSDARGRHEASIFQAELGVKNAELEQARELLAMSAITSPKDGVAVYGDKRDLIGRPVSIGERLMEIADTKMVELRIDVPVSDSILLATGARVKAFLDSDPLKPIDAKVVRSDYHAKAMDAGILAFRVIAELDSSSTALPRFGIRGTAQLYGDRVSLAYYLFRRPIASFRQWTGI